jgi:hypothetical protein
VLYADFFGQFSTGIGGEQGSLTDSGDNDDSRRRQAPQRPPDDGSYTPIFL